MLFVSSCSDYKTLSDMDPHIREDLDTEYLFYIEKPETSATGDVKYVTRKFRTGTRITGDMLKEIMKKEGCVLTGWRFLHDLDDQGRVTGRIPKDLKTDNEGYVTELMAERGRFVFYAEWHDPVYYDLEVVINATDPDGRLTYRVMEGEKIPSEIVEEVNEKLVRTHFTFTGWSTYTGAPFDWSDVITGDTLVVAGWKVITDYYVAEGGSDDARLGEGSKDEPYATVTWASIVINSLGTFAGERDFTIHITGTITENINMTINNSSLKSITIVGERGLDTDGMPQDVLRGDETSGSVIDYSSDSSDCDLILKDIRITGGNASNGGGIYFRSANVLEVESGTYIVSNTAGGAGGGIYIPSGWNGSVKMSGGTIASNTSSGYGSAVYIESGSFQMTGGSITGNESRDDGYAVYCEYGTSVGGLKECSIESNIGGGIRLPDTTSINKNVVIKDNNTSAGTLLNMYIPSGKKLTLKEASGSSEIHVTTQDKPSSAGATVTFTSGYSINSPTLPGVIFISDEDYGVTRDADGEAVLAVSSGSSATGNIAYCDYNYIGTDSDGTENKPYKTLDDALRSFTDTATDKNGDEYVNTVYFLDDFVVTDGIGTGGQGSDEYEVYANLIGCKDGTPGTAITITGDISTGNVLYMQNKQRFKITNINFTSPADKTLSNIDRKTGTYSALFVSAGCSLELKDVQMTGLKARGCSAIHVDGDCYLEDVTIESNLVITPTKDDGSADTWGCAINVGKGTLSLAGKINISNNIAYTEASPDAVKTCNIFIGTSNGTSETTYFSKLNMKEALDAGSQIGVTLYNEGDATGAIVFTDGYKNSDEPSAYFTSDDTDYEIVKSEGSGTTEAAKRKKN